MRPHFAPWDERELPRLLSASEGARRVAVFAQVDRRLAELLGEWAASAAGESPQLATMLRRHARHAEWHASLWSEALSDSGGGDDDAAAKTLLDAIADASDTIERLAGVYRGLLPYMVTAHTFYQRAIGTEDTEADARWIGLILKDELDAVRDGELALQSVLAGSAEVERAAKRRAALETLLVTAGGLVGPDSLGMAKSR